MVNGFDLGSVLFRDVLRISEYPGHPFTGEVLSDLVMFFFIPTVFIILLIYVILGMLFLPEHKMLRMLFGLAIYLFIIFGGYFSVFALLTGPLFLWLIFGLGLLAVLSRFAPPFMRGGRGLAARLPQKVKTAEEKDIKRLQLEIERLEHLRDAAKERSRGGDREAERLVDEYTSLIQQYREELEDLKEAMGRR